MNSKTTRRFWDLFRTLPPTIRKQAYKAYQQFTDDLFHPSLNFEEVDKQRNLWSARVTRGYRVLGNRADGEIRWFWIGTHSDYEKLISRH